MFLIRQPILIVFAILAAAIGLSDALVIPPWAILTTLGVFVALLLVGMVTRRGVALAALATLFACGALAARLRAEPPPLVDLCQPEGGVWRAEVVAPIERQIDPQSGRVRRRSVLALRAERCGEGWRPRRGRVRAALWEGAPVARGDRLQLRMRIEPLAMPRNPTDLDPRRLARQLGLVGSATVLSGHAVELRGGGPLALIDQLRERAARMFENHLDGQRAALAKALSMGDRASISPATRERWAKAGMAHLLAISGLHVGFIAGLLYLVCFAVAARLPGAAERFSTRRLAAAASMPGVILFALWTGAPPSAVRAAVMACAFLLAVALGRGHSAKNALGVAGLLILLADPSSLYAPGFLLSFAAVAGLLLAPRLWPAHGWWPRLRRAVLGTLLASLVASVVTAPFVAYLFGRVSLVAPLSNVIAVPVGAALAMPLALLVAVVAPLGEGVLSVLTPLLGGVLSGLDSLAQAAAGMPYAALDLPRPRWYEIVAFASLALAALLFLRRFQPRRMAVGGLLLLLLCVGVRVHERMGDGQLRIIHPYVGQGDAAIILLPQGGVVLFDAGGSLREGGWDPGQGTVGPLLRLMGIRTIDLAVVSHPHPDHIGGFDYIADNFPIREVWYNGMAEHHPIMEKLARRAERVHIAAELPLRSEREGVRFEIISPRPGADAEGLPYFPERDTNDNSIVLRLTLGERSFLLPGDIELESEQDLAPLIGRAALMKVPHHGSSTSSSWELLAAVRPEVAILSCGHRNHFGFPAGEVVERYREAGVMLLRTDQDGMITAVTDGRRWQVESFRGKRWLQPERVLPPMADSGSAPGVVRTR